MKKKNTKRKGYVLMIIIIIMFILTSVVMSVTMLSISHSNDIIKDVRKSRAYYISNAALEMMYSVLSETKVSGTTVNFLEIAGSGNFDIEKTNIIPQSQIEIRNQSGQVLGFANVHADLRQTSDGRWYYKIVANGRIDNSPNPGVKDTHILTMIVFADDANNPKIYEGDRNIN